MRMLSRVWESEPQRSERGAAGIARVGCQIARPGAVREPRERGGQCGRARDRRPWSVRRAEQFVQESFTAYLRQIEVAPNGHPNAARRRLRGKGVRFILETCRSL